MASKLDYIKNEAEKLLLDYYSVIRTAESATEEVARLERQSLTARERTKSDSQYHSYQQKPPLEKKLEEAGLNLAATKIQVDNIEKALQDYVSQIHGIKNDLGGNTYKLHCSQEKLDNYVISDYRNAEYHTYKDIKSCDDIVRKINNAIANAKTQIKSDHYSPGPGIEQKIYNEFAGGNYGTCEPHYDLTEKTIPYLDRKRYGLTGTQEYPQPALGKPEYQRPGDIEEKVNLGNGYTGLMGQYKKPVKLPAYFYKMRRGANTPQSSSGTYLPAGEENRSMKNNYTPWGSQSLF